MWEGWYETKEMKLYMTVQEVNKNRKKMNKWNEHYGLIQL